MQQLVHFPAECVLVLCVEAQVEVEAFSSRWEAEEARLLGHLV